MRIRHSCEGSESRFGLGRLRTNMQLLRRKSSSPRFTASGLSLLVQRKSPKETTGRAWLCVLAYRPPPARARANSDCKAVLKQLRGLFHRCGAARKRARKNTRIPDGVAVVLDLAPRFIANARASRAHPNCEHFRILDLKFLISLFRMRAKRASFALRTSISHRPPLRFRLRAAAFVIPAKAGIQVKIN